MRRPKAITDYYGHEVTVEDLMGSPGPVVDVAIDGVDALRFTAEGAADLADELLRAAGWPERATRP